METIGILTNKNKDKDYKVTRYLINELEVRGIKKIVIPKDIANQIGRYDIGVSLDDLFNNVDIMMVLGGDGTILNAVRTTIDSGIPVIGINLGHLGFLTEIETYGISDCIDKLIKKDYSIEERMMLSANIMQNGNSGRDLYALNDISIVRDTGSRIIHIEVFVDNNLVDKYPADGVIVSSPTGSTAYSLSAGGPIISPKMQCMLITPICPHSLHTRPIVVSTDEVVSFRIIDQQRESFLLVDGQESFKINTNDIITIKKAKKNAKFIKLNEKNFYSLLRQKLSEWNYNLNDD